MQNHLNLLYREDEREILPACESEGVVCTPYSPMAAGKLCNPWGTETRRALNDVKIQQKYKKTEAIDRPVVDRVEKVAGDRGVTMAEIALAWVQHKSAVQAPIVGVTENHMIDSALRAMNLKLTEEEISYLEELYQPHDVVGALRS